ncbi:MAG TPA: hypothetical protein VGG75_04980 [Trebonia sp.]
MRSGAQEPDGWLTQRGHSVRFEWGPAAGAALTGGICVVVDVLRFTTAVEAAVARGAAVYPYRWQNAETAQEFAESVGAVLAIRGDASGHRDRVRGKVAGWVPSAVAGGSARGRGDPYPPGRTAVAGGAGGDRGLPGRAGRDP